MIKDKEGKHYALSKVSGNDRQICANVPRPSWAFFPVGSRVRVFSKDNIDITRKVSTISNGNQRIVYISSSDKDVFTIGEPVKMYPLDQSLVSKSQINKQKNDERTDTNRENSIKE